MPQFYAKAAAMLGVFANVSENSAEVQFRDASDNSYTVDVPEPILGSLIAALLAIAPQLKPSGYGQMLKLTGGRIFQIRDGRIGLELTLNGTLRLPLMFHPNGISALRDALDELEARAKKGLSHELVINLKTALEVPGALSARADEVIE